MYRTGAEHWAGRSLVAHSSLFAACLDRSRSTTSGKAISGWMASFIRTIEERHVRFLEDVGFPDVSRDTSKHQPLCGARLGRRSRLPE